MRLVSPEGTVTRPTASRIREAVLNSLQSELAGARVLDLFAGSGAVGIEAISRGAAGCVWVERDRRVGQALRKNVEELQRRAGKQSIGVDPCEVCVDEIVPVLARLAKQGVIFDIIWADPPYADTLAHLRTILAQARQLCPSGVVIVESGVDLQATGQLAGWQLLKTKEYGETFVTFLKLEP